MRGGDNADVAECASELLELPLRRERSESRNRRRKQHQMTKTRRTAHGAIDCVAARDIAAGGVTVDGHGLQQTALPLAALAPPAVREPMLGTAQMTT